MCADIRGGTATAPAAGAPLQAWQCHGGANQQFALQTSGAVTAYGGALCLDVFGAQGNDGDAVVAWTCHGGTNQQWTYTAAGQLQTAINGKCLDLWGAEGQNGAKLVVWPCHGGSNQKWTVASATGVVVSPVVAPTAVGSAELPRVYLNTAVPTVTGRTLNVAAGGDLQGALDAAQPGDQVVLAAGATFTGNFVLPAKAGMSAGQWITVRTGGALPSAGTRVGPANAAQMPKLLTPNSEPALATAPATQGWRLVGLEIGASTQTSMTYAFVSFGAAGSGQTTLTQVPSRLVLDRSYVHGSARYNVRRCVVLNSASSAVIDSYLADCHSNDSDSQAILGWNGPGPFKIVNNYLEGGHEIVMFGGADPSLSGNVSSDIEFRGNHVTRPLSWKGVWQVKNLLELKTAQRVLVEGNVFENNWASAQNGFALVLNSANQEGRCTWCVTQDVTFRSNIVRNTPQGFNLASLGPANTGPAQPMRRITIANNVVTGVDAQGGRMFQVIGSVAGVTIAHNTAIGGSADVYFVTPDQALPTFVFQNNITGGTYTLFGDGGLVGSGALARLAIPVASVQGNVFVGSSTPNMIPSGNSFATSASAVGFASLSGGDLTLTASASPYRAAGTGGSTPGADITALAAATSGVVR